MAKIFRMKFTTKIDVSIDRSNNITRFLTFDLWSE